VGREKFLKCDFFNYIKIESYKKWESEKTILKKLQLSNFLRLKITGIDVDINAVINSNRKQAHQ
jgi:hypothetical protein